MTDFFWYQQAAHSPNESVRNEALARQNQLTKTARLIGAARGGCGATGGATGASAAAAASAFIWWSLQAITAWCSRGFIFPQSVTIAMLANFVQGGAAVSVLCQQHGISLKVVNCGTATPCPDFPKVVQAPVMAGTMDFSVQAAMTEAQALQALAIGQAQVDELAQTGCDLF